MEHSKPDKVIFFCGLCGDSLNIWELSEITLRDLKYIPEKLRINTLINEAQIGNIIT